MILIVYLLVLPMKSMKYLMEEWNKTYQLLVNYHWKNGHSNAPQSYYTEEGIWLGKWVQMQRAVDKDGMLMDE